LPAETLNLQVWNSRSTWMRQTSRQFPLFHNLQVGHVDGGDLFAFAVFFV